MKTLIRHGECLLLPVGEVPSDAVTQKVGKEHVVAHSESGHHHVLVGVRDDAVAAFTSGNRNFVRVAEGTRIEHRKTGPDAHRALSVPAGAYEVRAKTEFDYTANLRREVRD